MSKENNTITVYIDSKTIFGYAHKKNGKMILDKDSFIIIKNSFYNEFIADEIHRRSEETKKGLQKNVQG